MTRSRHNSAELQELVGRLCNEELDDAGQARLNDLLGGDAEAQAWYVRYVDLHASVRSEIQSLDDEDFTLLEVQAALNAAPSPGADDRFPLDAEALCSTPVEGGDLRLPSAEALPLRWVNRLWAGPARQLAWAVAAAVLVVGWYLGAHRPTEKLADDIAAATKGTTDEGTAESAMFGPAQLTGAVGARWAGAHLELPEDQYFEDGQRLELVEGLAEIVFRGGGRILLQGPAVMVVGGDASARVSVGRFAAVAPRSKSLFTVSTAVAQLASRDGEFGAEIDVDGSLVTQVYDGNVEIQFTRGESPATTVQLAGGQGAKIDASTRRVTPLAQPYDLHFVRYLPQHELLVNLADVVAGGNGVRRAYHEGIRVVDGEPTNDFGAPAKGDGQYHRVRGREFVDGVFIPNGKQGPTQVDSIGRQFAEFPPTAGDCWGGAIMARRPQEEKSLPFIRLEYHGDISGYVNWLHIATQPDELSPQGHGLIGMHSNSGITFDLHAIRERYPNKKIVKFRAQVGNLESKTDRYEADAWIIVDGQLRYRRQKFSREDGAESIDVPLSDRDRFLSLAVTDVGGNTAYDWVAFGDPVIELTDVNETSADAGLRSAPQPAAEIFEAGFSPPRPPFMVAFDKWPKLATTSPRLATQLFASQVMSSIGNHVERTNAHDMTFARPADARSLALGGRADRLGRME